MTLTAFLEFTIIMVGVIYVHTFWARFRIRQWMDHRGYRLTRCRLCFITIGPFSYFGTSGKQSVFKIEAVGSDGNRRTGYTRAGGFFLGLLQNRVQVKWDKSLLDTILKDTLSPTPESKRSGK